MAFGRNGGGLAVITGASSGIGLELARIALAEGHRIIAAADHFPAPARRELERAGADIVETDLATARGVARLVAAVGGRPVALLCANAGHGLGEGFLDQDFADIRHMIDTNITGTVDLVQQLARPMAQAGRGRILLTGSIAGIIPGPWQAAYGATKAFINSFGEALRQELEETGVTVTVLMPGATDTAFFARAGMADTKVANGPLQDPAEVAENGWRAMMAGAPSIVSGAGNKAQAFAARVLPTSATAAGFGKLSEPGGARGGASLSPLMAIGGGLALGALAMAINRLGLGGSSGASASESRGQGSDAPPAADAAAGTGAGAESVYPPHAATGPTPTL